MTKSIQHNIVIGLFLIAGSSLLIQAHAQNDNDDDAQTSMTAELKTAIERGGATAAKVRFAEIYPAQKAQYPFDAQTFMQLITEYAQTGDMDIVQVLGDINATLSQEMMREQMEAAQPQMSAMMEQYQQAVNQANQQQQAVQQREPGSDAKTEHNKQVQLRSDLDRFTGFYGATNDSSPHRQLWVSQSCEGQLVVGATWGDAAPWWMHSAADAAFTYGDNFFSLAIAFKLDAENHAIELSHDLENLANPLVRTGPLTADYQACIKPHRR